MALRGMDWITLKALLVGQVRSGNKKYALYNIAFLFLGAVFEMGSAILLNEISRQGI